VVASMFAGAVGAVLGAGIGSVVRNTGGAVTGTFLFVVIAPTLIAQFASSAASWVPGTLAGVLSGVGHEVALPAAVAAIAAWALVPAVLGLVSVNKRDVV
jgi:ABC-2 type transport system permease protein